MYQNQSDELKHLRNLRSLTKMLHILKTYKKRTRKFSDFRSQKLRSNHNFYYLKVSLKSLPQTNLNSPQTFKKQPQFWKNFKTFRKKSMRAQTPHSQRKPIDRSTLPCTTEAKRSSPPIAQKTPQLTCDDELELCAITTLLQSGTLPKTEVGEKRVWRRVAKQRGFLTGILGFFEF